MKHLTTLFLIVLLTAGCSEVDDGAGMPIAACPGGKPCIPVNPGQPGNVPFATTVSKSRDGAFSFLLEGRQGQGNTWLIFKCQVMDAQAPDCRTPAKDGNGDPLWAVKLNRGRLKDIELGNDPVCTECLEQGHKDCADNACRYPWMVIDLSRPNQQPIDPIMIVTR